MPEVRRKASEIIRFWQDAGMERWFEKDDAFDANLRDRFLQEHFAAARRERDQWSNEAEGALALLILLDQFPRNAFRGCAHMFATDALALMFAHRFLAKEFDKAYCDDLRMFFYLPFTHSEDPADQRLSLRLRRALGPRIERRSAEHLDIIARFGRFPHRNAVLGRKTTAEEQAFLDAGGFCG